MIFSRYAEHYDVFYRAKDYRRECDYLEKLFRRYAKRKPKTVLDLGCGTGNHAFPLAQKGYTLTGIDASRRMLQAAQRKNKDARRRVKFYRGTLQTFRAGGKFDVVICMFSVIDYLLELSDLKKALRNITRHMKKDSLFIFDFWNQRAVEKLYMPRKQKVFFLNGKVIERSSLTKIFPSRRLCRVDYTCTLKKGGRIIDRFKERHTVRYFAVEEMARLLNEAGLRVLYTHPFLSAGGKVRSNTWDVTVVAQRDC